MADENISNSEQDHDAQEAAGRVDPAEVDRLLKQHGQDGEPAPDDAGTEQSSEEQAGDGEAQVSPEEVEKLLQEKDEGGAASVTEGEGDGSASEEAGPADEAVTVTPARFGPLPQSEPVREPRDLDVILDIPVVLAVELGRKSMSIEDVINLGPGSVIELEKLANDPVEILVNDKLIAVGEVVVVNDNFGVRITSVVDPRQRIKNLG